MLALTIGVLADASATSRHDAATLAGPLLVAALLFACGVLCALGLLLAAVALTRWRAALRLPWSIVRGLPHRRGVPALVERRPRTRLTAQAVEAALVPLAQAALVVYPASGPEAPPLAQESGRARGIESDPRTLRAFAGQPEVLRRLAFCRWCYQRGQLSEFGSDQAEV